MTIHFEADSICVNGSYIATSMGRWFVLQDDNGVMWELRPAKFAWDDTHPDTAGDEVTP